MDLTKSLFQFCMSFTLKQKLAPLWNKAGQFLVQGMNNHCFSSFGHFRQRPSCTVRDMHNNSPNEWLMQTIGKMNNQMTMAMHFNAIFMLKRKTTGQEHFMDNLLTVPVFFLGLVPQIHENAAMSSLFLCTPCFPDKFIIYLSGRKSWLTLHDGLTVKYDWWF